MQAGYEGMVHARASRTDTTADLRVLRLNLARSITRYNGAVITTMLDDQKPETWELVQQILRPVFTSRIGRPRTSGSKDDDEGTPEEDAVEPVDAVEPEPELVSPDRPGPILACARDVGFA